MKIAPASLWALSLLLFLPDPLPAEEAVYEVTIVNRARSSLTPILWATHGTQARMFRRGKRASIGIEELAKDGILHILRKEMQAQQRGAGGVNRIGVASGIGRKSRVTFTIRTDEEQRYLSWATMAACSNDTFAGQDRFRLPLELNRKKRRLLRALDAGAEVNTESRDDVPCLGAHGVGPVENKPIRISDAIRGDADLPRSRGWGKYIAKITVERIR